MDLAALIRSFATASGYTVTRKARGTIVKGRVATGTVSTFSVVASVSPAARNDIEKLPQGRQFDEAKVVITTSQLMAGGVSAAYEADVIGIGPKTYEVSNLDTWFDPASGNTAYRAIVTAVSR